MRNFVPALLGSLILCASATANAGDGIWAKAYFEGGGEFGGDTLGTVFFVGGTSQDVKANQGLWGGVGLNLRADEYSRYGPRTGIGYKYVTTQATNVDIHVSRVMLELMPYARFSNDFWLSAGLVKHASVKLDAGGLAPNESFDSSAGLRAEMGWKWVGVSYQNLTYTDRLNNDYKAGGFGIFLTSAFGGGCCEKPQPRDSYLPPAPRPPAAPAEPAAPMQPPATPVMPAAPMPPPANAN